MTPGTRLSLADAKSGLVAYLLAAPLVFVASTAISASAPSPTSQNITPAVSKAHHSSQHALRLATNTGYASHSRGDRIEASHVDAKTGDAASAKHHASHAQPDDASGRAGGASDRGAVSANPSHGMGGGPMADVPAPPGSWILVLFGLAVLGIAVFNAIKGRQHKHSQDKHRW